MEKAWERCGNGVGKVCIEKCKKGVGKMCVDIHYVHSYAYTDIYSIYES